MTSLPGLGESWHFFSSFSSTKIFGFFRIFKYRVFDDQIRRYSSAVEWMIAVHVSGDLLVSVPPPRRLLIVLPLSPSFSSWSRVQITMSAYYFFAWWFIFLVFDRVREKRVDALALWFCRRPVSFVVVLDALLCRPEGQCRGF